MAKCTLSFNNTILRMQPGGTMKNITPLYGAQSHSFLPVLMLSSHDLHTLFVGTGRLYQSKGSGNTWQTISPEWHVSRTTVEKYVATYPVAELPNEYPDSISAVAQSPVNPGLSVTSIVIDKEGNGYDTFGGGHESGFGCRKPTNRNLVLYKSSSSNSWRNVTGNLPQSPVNSSLVEGNKVYVGTGNGVFTSNIGSHNWAVYGTGIPNSPVTSLLRGNNGALIAATSGRGVWQAKNFENK